MGCDEDNGNAQNHCPSCDANGCPVCEKCKTCPNEGHDSISTKISGLTKSGERLKVYYYKGDDGSQLPIPTPTFQNPIFFDSTLEIGCNPFDYTMYGCDGLIYCVPTNFQSTISTSDDGFCSFIKQAAIDGNWAILHKSLMELNTY